MPAFSPSADMTSPPSEEVASADAARFYARGDFAKPSCRSAQLRRMSCARWRRRAAVRRELSAAGGRPGHEMSCPVEAVAGRTAAIGGRR